MVGAPGNYPRGTCRRTPLDVRTPGPAVLHNSLQGPAEPSVRCAAVCYVALRRRCGRQRHRHATQSGGTEGNSMACDAAHDNAQNSAARHELIACGN
eukprot:13127793-Alexandrium_andersonii.AAC.1